MLASGSSSVATNSMSSATPTVPNKRRVMELKKVLVNSVSGSPSICSAKRSRMLHPQRAIQRALAEVQAHLRDRLIHVAVVELDALHGIPLAALPVAVVEARGRAARDGAELSVVVREGFRDAVGAFGGRVRFRWRHRGVRPFLQENRQGVQRSAPTFSGLLGSALRCR